ncbi:MAG: hypothetical protein LIP02_03665 [Bacteroidales bacterium]|nr:hypothetical protein [Bacteroidales bacterium]
MKNQYKIALMAAGLLAVTSCAKHDPIPDQMEIGVEVPTCYWSVGSTACKAGESFTFTGKYYTATDRVPHHSEVWYAVTKAESAAATVKLAGSALSYTKTVTLNDTVRESQSIAVFYHSEDLWNGYEYEVTGEVPTSSTLGPVDWKEVVEWDEDNFKQYYPEGFDTEFKAEVIAYLTNDSTYINSLRTVYINYAFTNEQFAAINSKYGISLPTDIENDPEDLGKAIEQKGNYWYTTTEASDDKITGYYYKTVDANGNTIVVELGNDSSVTKDDDGNYWKGEQRCFPVYDSCAWVFCRYDDDAGSIVNSVRPKWMEGFKELLTVISFPEWIYDSTNSFYTVEFSRSYSLDAKFKVYDRDPKNADAASRVGVAADVRTITLN